MLLPCMGVSLLQQQKSERNMKEYAEQFYKSTRWKKARASYLASISYICERCGRLATMVHHKTYITEDNIDDPDITLSFDNFEGLCDTCHQHEHHKTSASNSTVDGVAFDESGQLVEVKTPDVFLVYGPPAGGKTTWCKEHARDNDIVVDLDVIRNRMHVDLNAALKYRWNIYKQIANGETGCQGSIYIIETAPSRGRREKLDKLMRFKDVILIDPGKQECLKRAEADLGRTDKEMQRRIIESWYSLKE